MVHNHVEDLAVRTACCASWPGFGNGTKRGPGCVRYDRRAARRVEKGRRRLLQGRLRSGAQTAGTSAQARCQTACAQKGPGGRLRGGGRLRRSHEQALPRSSISIDGAALKGAVGSGPMRNAGAKNLRALIHLVQLQIFLQTFLDKFTVAESLAPPGGAVSCARIPKSSKSSNFLLGRIYRIAVGLWCQFT